MTAPVGATGPQPRAVLIGVADYHVLPPRPSIRNNLSALRTLLTTPGFGMFPVTECWSDVGDPRLLAEQLVEVSRDTRGDLVVYFAGHGLRDPRNDQLYLATTGSTEQGMHTDALPVRTVAEILAGRSGRTTVLVLDCCFSGAAGPLLLAAQPAWGDLAVFAACPTTVQAQAPPGATFTTFTGELIATLRTGVTGARDPLPLESVAGEVTARMTRRRHADPFTVLPQPQWLASNRGGAVCLTRNAVVTTAPESATSPTWPGDPRLDAVEEPTPRLARLHRQLGTLRRERGPDDPVTVAHARTLGFWLAESGDARGALAVFTELLERGAAQPDPGDPAALVTWAWYAAALAGTGRTTPALVLLDELVPTLEATLGGEHPETLAARDLRDELARRPG